MADFAILTKSTQGWAPVLDANGDINISSDAKSLVDSVDNVFPKSKIQLVEIVDFIDDEQFLVVGGSSGPDKATVDAVAVLTPFPGDEV